MTRNSERQSCFDMEEYSPPDPGGRTSSRTLRSNKRKRVALACTRCRERKVRCDGQKPICGKCIVHDSAALPCNYTVVTTSAKQRSEKEYIASLQRQVSEYQRQMRTGTVLPNISLDQPITAFEYEQRSPQLHVSISDLVGADEDLAHSPSQSSRGRRTTNLPHLSSPSRPLRRTSSQNRVLPECASETSTPRRLHHESEHDDNFIVDDRTQQTGTTVNAMGTVIPGQALRTPALREYYGQSSVVSLMQEVSQSPQATRPISSRTYRSSETTAGVGRGSSKPDTTDTLLQARLCLPPRRLAEKLLGVYFRSVHIFYPWVHSPSFHKIVDRLWLGDENVCDLTENAPDIGLGGAKCSHAVFYCALNAMLAMGSEFSDLPSEEKEAVSSTFGERMKELLHVGIFDGGSIAHIQALLIAGHYLSCTQYPTQTWNVVGMAGRMALGLGLHDGNCPAKTTILETEIRRRVWHGCLQMDMNVSMTLGRPPTLLKMNRCPLPATIDDEFMLPDSTSRLQPEGVFPMMAFCTENIKLAILLGEVLEKIYHQPIKLPHQKRGVVAAEADCNHEQASIIIQLDSLLQDFAARVPEMLHGNRRRAAGFPDNAIIRRQGNVLLARYLHIKVMLYRPSFTSYCRDIRKMPHRSRTSTGQDMVTTMHIRFAVACVENACELVRAIEKAAGDQATGAWWWSLFYLTTSAIILIIAESTPSLMDELDSDELSSSWESCVHALNGLSHGRSRVADNLQSLQDLRDRALAAQENPPGSRHHHKERTRNVAPQVSPPPWPLWENTNTTTTTTTTQQTPGLDINYSIEVVDEGEPTTTPTTRLAFDHAGSFPFVAGHTASNNTNDHDFADWFVEEFGTDPSTAYLRVENWDPLGQSGLA